MGLYSFQVLDENGQPTGEELEEIYKWNAVPDMLISSSGRRAKRKGVEVIAKITDTSKFGLNGVYNRGLGTVVTDWRHYEQIMAERGLVRESDLPKHYFEESLERADRFYEKEEKETLKHLNAVKDSGLEDAEKDTKEYFDAVDTYWETMLPAREVWGAE